MLSPAPPRPIACVACPIFYDSFQLTSTWFKFGRGVALGAIIGGLSLGSSVSHLIVGAGGVGDRWRIVTVGLICLVRSFLFLWRS